MKLVPKEDRASRGSRRTLVLEAAAKALNNQGVSQTSLSAIAQQLGISRAALYYYFEDQQDLVFQSYRRSCEMFAGRLNEASHGAGDAMTIIDRFVDGMLSDEHPEFASLSEAAFLRPEQRSTIFGLYQGILSSLTDVLRTGARRGELRQCANGIVAQAIIGLISRIPMARRWRPSDPLSDTDLVDAIKSMLRHGMATDRRAALDYEPLDLSPSDIPIERVFDPDALIAAKQEALLAAASWLFNLKGIDATSLDEIALRVGVSKMVIYHNVGDKEELVIACYRRAFDFYESIASRMTAYKGSRIAAVSASAHALTEANLREDIAPLAPLAGFEALPARAKSEMQAASNRVMESYLKAYAKGRREGSIRNIHARAFFAIEPGIFQWLPKWFDILDAGERQIAGRELANLTRIGLSAV